MAKIVLIVVVFALVYLVVRAYLRSMARKSGASAAPKVGEDMVRCTHCGIHLPRSESLADDGRYYCSKEHQRLGRR